MSTRCPFHVLLVALVVVAIGTQAGLAQPALSGAVLLGQVHLQARTSYGGVLVAVGGQSITTNADGSFVLLDAPTGNLVVRASAPGFLSAEGMLDVAASQTSTLAAITLPGGDINGDGVIQLLDLVALGVAFGQCPPQDAILDLNADGCLNIFDLVILGGNYGRSGPLPWGPGSAPTPTIIPTVAPSDTPTTTPTLVANEVLCTRVIDGDTIELVTGHHVRLIGIDTPELRTAECYAVEATLKTTELVLGKMVRLEKDISETDLYGRLLRYVYVGETFVNAELVGQGYAQVHTYTPDVRYADEFLRLQQEARDANRGLWSACLDETPTVTETPIHTPALTETPTVTATLSVTPFDTATPTPTFTPVQGQCSCSGNLYNCGDFATHAQAQACYDHCMMERGFDVHNLDADDDGQACELLP